MKESSSLMILKKKKKKGGGNLSRNLILKMLDWFMKHYPSVPKCLYKV